MIRAWHTKSTMTAQSKHLHATKYQASIAWPKSFRNAIWRL